MSSRRHEQADVKATQKPADGEGRQKDGVAMTPPDQEE
jgi:hypothetical protein